MLKKANNPIILTTDDYIELFGVPAQQVNNLNSMDRLAKWILQATDQFDSLISARNNAGSLYRWWNDLKDNDQDNQKGYKLQKAIGSWVETYIQTGKYFTDGAPTIQSNIEIDLNASSDNVDVERKRMDIIQDLVSIGLYSTTNIGEITSDITEEKIQEYIVVSIDWLYANFLALKPQPQGLSDVLALNGKSIQNTGNIVGLQTNPNKPTLENFKLQNVDLGDEVKAKYIFDPIDNIYKLINAFDVNYFGGLTQEEIYIAIAQSGSAFNLDFVYRKGYIVQFIDTGNFLKWAESLQDDNQGNEPTTSPLFWNVLDSVPIDVELIIEQLKPYIEIEVAKQIDELDKLQLGNGLELTNNDTILQVDSTIATKDEVDELLLNYLNINTSGDKPINGNIFFVGGQASFRKGLSVGSSTIENVADAVEDNGGPNLGQVKRLIADIPIPIINDWVQVLTPNQTTDGAIGSGQVFTLPDMVKDYSSFRVIGKSIANPKGQFQFTFVNMPTSYGKAISTGLYLGASNQQNEMKWINNSGNGSTGSIALYVDFAMIEIQGKKR